MTQVTLPKLNQTGANEWADVEDNDKALRDVINGGLDNANLSGSAGITGANIADGTLTAGKLASGLAAPGKAKITATEEARTNAAYGTLTTPDKVEGIVLATKGLILVRFRAAVKESVNNTGAADLFLGATQLKAVEGVNTPTTNWATGVGAPSAGTFLTIGSAATGLTRTANSYSALASTGQVFDSGIVAIGATAGTYEVSVQFKASSGTVTAKDRSLFVWTQEFA